MATNNYYAIDQQVYLIMMRHYDHLALLSDLNVCMHPRHAINIVEYISEFDDHTYTTITQFNLKQVLCDMNVICNLV